MTAAMRTGIAPANENESRPSHQRQGGHRNGPGDAETGADASDAARSGKNAGDAPLTDQEVVQLLQRLNATIDSAQHVLYSGLHTLEGQVQQAEGEAGAPPRAPRPVRHRRSRAVLISSAAAGLLGGLGWFGWQHLQEVSLSPAGAGQEATAQSTAAPDMAERPAGTDGRPEQAQAPTAIAVLGQAGEPIPLGITLPPQDGATEVSVMIRGVPEGASLSAGRHMGGDTWVLNADEVPDAALHVPEDFAASQVRLGFYVVASDGRVPQAHTITVGMEPAPAPLSPMEQIVADVPPQEQPAEQEPGQPEAPLKDANAKPLTDIVHEVRTVEIRPDGTQSADVDAGTSLSENIATEAAEAPATGVASIAPASEPQPPLPSQEPDQTASRIEALAAQPPRTSEDLPAPSRTGKVTTHVNMRAGPGNDAAVLTVVGTGKEVGIVECLNWCEVVYAGQQGWIHSRFIADAGASAANAAPAAPARVAPAPAPAPARTSEGGFGSRIRSLFGFQ